MTATHQGDSAASDECGCEENSAQPGCIFDREVIKFSLYGKALPSSECTLYKYIVVAINKVKLIIVRRYSEQMKKMLADAQDGYKNMPSIFHFASSAVNLVALGVYTSEQLLKGILTPPLPGPGPLAF